jgi:hypothetical protein
MVDMEQEAMEVTEVMGEAMEDMVEAMEAMGWEWEWGWVECMAWVGMGSWVDRTKKVSL